MTTDEIQSALADNSLALAAAREDEALFARLTKAKATVASLQKDGDRLTAAYEAARAAEADAERKDVADKVRSLSVATSFHEGPRSSGVLAATFTISWDGPRWNAATRESEIVRHTCTRFDHLPPHVSGYIMQHRPDVLPTLITDLCPGDPWRAMDRYMVALRRGYVA